jgi:hypothetical protein
MTTSGVIASTMTVSDIVTMAMRELGLLSAGETPTGQELQDGITQLNWLMKSWQVNGVTSWRDTESSLVFPTGTATMQLDPYCLDVLEARLVQSPGYERPLQRWVLGQYRQIPNKAIPGWPTAFTISKTRDTISMTVWPVPNQDLTVNYSYSRVIQDVTDGAETLDVPQEWLEAVYLGLAARMLNSYGAARLDPTAAQIVIQRAAALEQKLLDADRPASVFMGSTYNRVF